MPIEEQGKPTDAGLKGQLKRVAGYHGYEDLKYELLRVLKSHASSNEHAERIVTHILDTRRPNENGFSSCPTPAELIDYALQVPASLDQRRNPDKNCSVCGGSGWRIVELKGISGAEKCQCLMP
jgi:hypothetical protein